MQSLLAASASIFRVWIGCVGKRGLRRQPTRSQALMGTWGAWGVFGALCLSGLPLPARAAPTLADCNAPTAAQVLVPALGNTPQAAQAHALDGRFIHWSGLAPGGRVRLLHSASAALHAEPGAPARGEDGALTLQAVAPALGVSPEPGAPALPTALAQRFKYLEPGRVLALRAADVARLRPLLRQQLLLVQEDAAGRVMAATRVQVAGALDDLFAPAAERWADYGASAQTGRFRLWAPTAQRVSLCLYGAGVPGVDGPARALVALQRDAASGSWWARPRGAWAGHAYAYLVDVYVPGLGLVRNRVTDPYSLGLTADSKRSVVLNLNDAALQPPGWLQAVRPAPLKAATDMVIYELHVRDFSVADTSVPPALRGRYGAFTQTGSQGMRHLQALAAAGLTDVHLLPIFDIASVPEVGCVSPDVPAAAPDAAAQQAALEPQRTRDCFNWGYDPLHFNVPEGSYASNAADPARRVLELRQMVQALHASGLRVGMDVVYNHTSASGQAAQSVLDRIVPGYYHRLDAKGAVERSTCCDNTATEHRMMAKLMIDSAVIWARDYRIDSFRFDLMGHQPRAAMEDLQRAVNAAAGRPVQLIGEGWNYAEVADGKRFVQASQLSLNGSGIGTFNDRLRDAVRGGGAGEQGADQIARQGFVNGLHHAPNALAAGKTTLQDLWRSHDAVRAGLAGSLRNYRLVMANGENKRLSQLPYGDQPLGYVSQPSEVVNYVENHDNQTLFDAQVFKLPLDTSGEDRARAQHLGHALVAFSQGIAYFHAGQELLRSKSMDRNSYDSGDWFNRIDWSAQDNGFGRGLPPRQDNESSWPWMAPLLAQAALKPRPQDMAWTRDAFLDLLKIRASSPLLRLRDAQAIEQRLRFLNAGPGAVPTLVAAQIDGQGYAGAGAGAGADFKNLAYFVNVGYQAQSVALPPSAADAQGRFSAWPYVLHPVFAAPSTADKRAATAKFDIQTGRFEIPARTAVVFVVR